jgi:8-oxo-dGTP pyrophosphatase MutT (NUDIX family)
LPAPEHIAARRSIAPAATLLLLRERDSRVEVLMTRRRKSLRFMGGMWVFPGGRVDPPDCGRQAAALVAAPSGAASPAMCALDGLPLAPALALGLQVAACRETYEEAGVLLARHRDGRPPSAAELEALTSARHEARAAGAFLDLVASADLLLDVDRLVYWSHWITPSQEPRRFDTRFFAVASPEGQAASLDRREAVEARMAGPALSLGGRRQRRHADRTTDAAHTRGHRRGVRPTRERLRHAHGGARPRHPARHAACRRRRRDRANADALGPGLCAGTGRRLRCARGIPAAPGAP